MKFKTLILLFMLIWKSESMHAQWDTIVFPDSTYKLMKIVAADGDNMPNFFVGFRGFAQLYAMKIWPKVGLLRATSGYSLFEKDFFYGADAMINLAKFRIHPDPINIQIGKSVTIDRSRYKGYHVRISEIPIVATTGFHLGYKHKEYQDHAIVTVYVNQTVSVPPSINFFYLNNIVVEEFYGGFGLTLRKGVILTELSPDFSEGFPQVRSYSAKWFSWMVYADVIFERAVSFTVSSFPNNVIAWEEKYSRFPSTGWRICGDVNWNYTIGKNSRNFVSISGHFGVQHTEIAFMNEPIRQRGYAIIATGGLFYSRRFRNYNERSPRVPKPIAPGYMK
jgi:hypothetical protein